MGAKFIKVALLLENKENIALCPTELGLQYPLRNLSNFT